jgi:hypothetical protein
VRERLVGKSRLQPGSVASLRRMPGQARAKVAADAASAICERLAENASIVLPSRWHSQQGEPTVEQAREYLAGLIDHDPASFLQR